MGLSLKEMSKMTDFQIGEKIYNDLNQSNQSHFLENAGVNVKDLLIRYGEMYRERAISVGINETEEYVDFNTYYKQVNNL